MDKNDLAILLMILLIKNLVPLAYASQVDGDVVTVDVWDKTTSVSSQWKCSSQESILKGTLLVRLTLRDYRPYSAIDVISVSMSLYDTQQHIYSGHLVPIHTYTMFDGVNNDVKVTIGSFTASQLKLKITFEFEYKVKDFITGFGIYYIVVTNTENAETTENASSQVFTCVSEIPERKRDSAQVNVLLEE